MENKILVSSTYKNNFTLLKYFHNFYKKYWKPSNFLYYVGNTTSQQENIEIIMFCLNGVKQTIANGLGLLGITPMKKM